MFTVPGARAAEVKKVIIPRRDPPEAVVEQFSSRLLLIFIVPALKALPITEIVGVVPVPLNWAVTVLLVILTVAPGTLAVAVAVLLIAVIPPVEAVFETVTVTVLFEIVLVNVPVGAFTV
jgi:hypothetical protein